MLEFGKQITAVEQIHFMLKSVTGRINEEAKRVDSNYFAGYADCKNLNCPVKYHITLKNLTNEQYLIFQVARTNEHEHQSQSKQIRGDERKMVAQMVKTDFKGSCKAFVDAMEGRGVDDG